VLGIIHERGKRGLPLEDVYRQLFNPDLFLLAYGKIHRNKGAMTPGATDETVDGMSKAKIDAIIHDLRYERYRWMPVRRVYIEKKNSLKKRPLGIPRWSDKLLQDSDTADIRGVLRTTV
jgi:retron-type reverse transcriptase